MTSAYTHLTRKNGFLTIISMTVGSFSFWNENNNKQGSVVYKCDETFDSEPDAQGSVNLPTSNY